MIDSLVGLDVNVERLGLVLAPAHGDASEVEGVLNPAMRAHARESVDSLSACVAKGNISRVGRVYVDLREGKFHTRDRWLCARSRKRVRNSRASRLRLRRSARDVHRCSTRTSWRIRHSARTDRASRLRFRTTAGVGTARADAIQAARHAPTATTKMPRSFPSP